MPQAADVKIPPLDPAQLRAPLIAWFKKHGRDLPWRRTHDPYAILVSEIMLQQTQVATVLDYYRRWLKRFPGFAQLAAASEAEVLAQWQGLGYYSRARNLHRAAQAVMQDHDGKMPANAAKIRILPGVGRYTAGAVATFAFDLPSPIVDANIARVIARLLDMRLPIDSTAGQFVLWREAEALQPRKEARLFNSALMELGALVCLPRTPKCAACPVKKSCRATDPATLPVKKPRRKTIALTEHCAWIRRNGRVLLEQQSGARLRGMWKLPPLRERTDSSSLLQLTYPFTHHKVTMDVFEKDEPVDILPSQRWVAVKDLKDVAIAAPHRRAIVELLQRNGK